MSGKNREFPRLGNSKSSYADEHVALDGVKIYRGEMIQQDDTTFEVESASATEGKFVLGVATKAIDNTDGGKTIEYISTAVHGMDNCTTNPCTKADIGKTAYVVDAATVTSTCPKPYTKINKAGTIVDITSDYVYIDFDPAKQRYTLMTCDDF